jgi:AcrR family transcriptional regulator
MRADAQRNYDRLVDTARKVFAEQGSDASMEAVAKHAGVGVGTLYRHFPKRIDLVEAVWREDVDSLVDSVRGGLADLQPWDALEAWLRSYVDYARAKRFFINELQEAFEKQPNIKSETRDRIIAAAGHVLGRAQEAGVARADIDAADLMQLISPMCTTPTFELSQADRLITLVLDGLRAPAAASAR